jgi:hypothetical protein
VEKDTAYHETHSYPKLTANTALLLAGIQDLFATAEETFKTGVAAQADWQRDARAKRLHDSIRMLAQ